MYFIIVKPHNAIAQTYIFVSCPRSGEVMVITAQDGNGIVPVPISAQDNSQNSNSNSVHKSRGASIDNYILR